MVIPEKEHEIISGQKRSAEIQEQFPVWSGNCGRTLTTKLSISGLRRTIVYQSDDGWLPQETETVINRDGQEEKRVSLLSST